MRTTTDRTTTISEFTRQPSPPLPPLLLPPAQTKSGVLCTVPPTLCLEHLGKRGPIIHSTLGCETRRLLGLCMETSMVRVSARRLHGLCMETFMAVYVCRLRSKDDHALANTNDMLWVVTYPWTLCLLLPLGSRKAIYETMSDLIPSPQIYTLGYEVQQLSSLVNEMCEDVHWQANTDDTATIFLHWSQRSSTVNKTIRKWSRRISQMFHVTTRSVQAPTTMPPRYLSRMSRLRISAQAILPSHRSEFSVDELRCLSCTDTFTPLGTRASIQILTQERDLAVTWHMSTVNVSSSIMVRLQPFRPILHCDLSHSQGPPIERYIPIVRHQMGGNASPATPFTSLLTWNHHSVLTVSRPQRSMPISKSTSKASASASHHRSPKPPPGSVDVSSGSEAESSGSDTERDDPGPLDSSEDEGDGKHKHARKRTTSGDKSARQHAHATAKDRPKRMHWGTIPAAKTYLEKKFDEWLSCGSSEARAKVAEEAAEHVVSTWRYPQTDGDVRKAVKVWFKNTAQAHRRAQKQPSEGAQGPGEPVAQQGPGHQLDVAPLLKVVKGRARSASSLWAEAHPEEVEPQTRGKNIGERQRVIKQLFESLPADEQATWRQKARDHRTSSRSNPDACFDNQRDFSRILGTILYQFPGFNYDQIGAAIIHVNLAMRDIHGDVIREQLTVGIPEDQPSFAEFEGGPTTQEQDRWRRYIAAALPSNPIRRDSRLEYAPDGRPLLRDFDNAWNRDQLACVLEAYLSAMWAFAGHPGRPDWEAIRRTPADYLPDSWISRCRFNEPSQLGLLELVLMYDALRKGEGSPAPFEFLSKSRSMPATRSEAPSADPPSHSPAQVGSQHCSANS
ncbi:hypothetical protein NUW54_g8254 [Trametes sanguinea]|uniref:Uncharacterized protein n=1 Tax=Trametes sanguinea TaxID=158606 RepID=A0ACC1PGK2_9APHY|nr:hypothetical protein NUW54_g8254 [Trametes sanguinea]